MLDLLLEGESPVEPLRTMGNGIEDNPSLQLWVANMTLHVIGFLPILTPCDTQDPVRDKTTQKENA